MTGNFFHFLVKWVLVGLICLILFGVLPGTDLVIIVGLFVAVRVFSLVAEARREEVTESHWETLAHDVAERWEKAAPAGRDSRNTS